MERVWSPGKSWPSPACRSLRNVRVRIKVLLPEFHPLQYEKKLRPKRRTMNLPIKFPSDAAVIVEEVARFRALSPAQRVQSIRGLLAAAALLIRLSPNAPFLRAFTLVQ